MLFFQTTVCQTKTVIQSRIIPTASYDGMEKNKRANLGKWNKKDPLRWPRMSDQVKWNALENSVYLQLPTYGPIAKKTLMLEMILYEEAFSLFGVIKKEMNIRKPSRRLKQIKDVSNQIKDLAKAMKKFSD